MNNKFIITIKRINDNKLKDKVEFEIPEDSDLSEWGYLFSAILANVSFNMNQIKELFNGGFDDEKIDGN
jgi:hypothetical protein